MTTWPGTLPTTFERRGYKEGLVNNTVKTPMDIGPAKRRRRSTAGVYPIEGSMVMSSTEVEALKTFYYDTVEETLPFDFTHPRNGSTISVVFESEPEILEEFAPGRYRVSIKFEVQP